MLSAMTEYNTAQDQDQDQAQAQNDVKDITREHQLKQEQDKVKRQGSRGVTTNALRGMSNAGTVNADSTGEVVDISDLEPPESIELSVMRQRLEAKLETIVKLFDVNTDYIVKSNISEDQEGSLVFTVSIVENTEEVMSLEVVVNADNTAMVTTKTEGEFDVAPVLEAVGNMPTLDRAFYDFKKQAKDGFLREALDRRNAEIRGLYAPKPKPKKKAKAKVENKTSKKKKEEEGTTTKS